MTMKPIHVYQDAGGEITASQKKVSLFPQAMKRGVYLRYTLKYKVPMTYWYTIETPNFWFDVDLRVLFQLPEDLTYMLIISSLISVKGRLRDYLANELHPDQTVEDFLIEKMALHPDNIFADRKYKKPIST
jgi:hypothetical protein